MVTSNTFEDGLIEIAGSDNVIADPDRLRAYESDAYLTYRQTPRAVVLPGTSDQVVRILKLCQNAGVSVVPRGAGTSLSGGAAPSSGSIVLGTAKLDQVLEIDLENRVAVVQPGVTNLAITRAVEASGYYFAPDPSSQIACTIGGNVAENSGGIHCLKHGVTVNNVLGLEIALLSGDVLRLGGKYLDGPDPDLLAMIIGSEGLLGVVTEVTVRILRAPLERKAMVIGFGSVRDAAQCVSDVIGAGMIPGAMEFLDQASVDAVENFIDAGYPRGAAAVLVVEVEGNSRDVECDALQIETIANQVNAVSLKVSRSETERQAFWEGRKAAFPACARAGPDYLCMDGTIPRGRLPDMLDTISRLSQACGIPVANVFHAGDGNLHPLIQFDSNVEGATERAEALGSDILRACVKMGGVLTGEHGVGIEKKHLMGTMFSDTDLAVQQRIKCAFDPDGLMNPGKVFPVLHRCVDLGWMRGSGGQLPFAHLERL